MNVTLVRHGKTQGNLLSQYVGVTDEPLCDEGRTELARLAASGLYPAAERVFVSPLIRASESADIIYPSSKSQVEPDLRECDFGAFEGMSYDELSDLPDYRAWLRSGGMTGFPGGEDQLIFRARCREAFERIVELAFEDNLQDIAIVAHGGTIMSILEGFSQEQGDFYRWHVKNGLGWIVSLDRRLWERDHSLLVLTPLGERGETESLAAKHIYEEFSKARAGMSEHERWSLTGGGENSEGKPANGNGARECPAGENAPPENER